jgi:alpha-galactosidase
MTFRGLRDAEIALVDIHEVRLEMARLTVERILNAGQYPATITTSTDRRQVLEGADAVLVTILCGDIDIWQHDVLIPMAHGVDTNIGDTRGPSGIFRALRTIPTMLAICRDMEELCPKALMLNYTNPMAILCHAMHRESSINVTGLCHSVQGTASMLADWVGVPRDEVDYVCAGINHLSWYLTFQHQGRDLYPDIRNAVATRPEIYNEEQVRNEMFLALGYYVTESSGHNSEYNWWFRKRPELIEEYCTHGTGWNPGHHAYILNEYRKRETTWEQDFADWINSPDWEDQAKVSGKLQLGHEYAAPVINAYLGGKPFRFNGNVPNTGIVTNLPQGCCVEVPVLASAGQLQPIRVGVLPKSVLPLTFTNATIEQMTVDGCLAGAPEIVYQAIANDPLTAAVLCLSEIREMVAEMFEKNEPHLPHFRKPRLSARSRMTKRTP